MARIRPINLHFPLGGMNRKFAYRQQPPYTSPICANVRGTDPVEGRERGGSRPGVGKAFYEQLGSGNPIRLLDQVSVLETNGLKVWTDTFDGTALSGVWSTASWVGTAPSILPTSGAAAVYEESVGAVRDALTHDATETYSISIFITPYAGEHQGKYYLYARMDNTTPVGTTDGVVAELDLSAGLGVYTGKLTDYTSSSGTDYAFTGGDDEYPAGAWFTLLIAGANVKAYWNGHQVLNQNVSGAAGKRLGFGMTCTEAGGICLVDTFKMQYRDGADSQTKRNILVASSNGELWRENEHSQLELLAVDPTIASDRRVQAQERTQLLYIADWGDPRVNGTDGTVAGNGVDLTASGVSDWTTYGIDVNTDVVVITDGQGSVTDLTYKISAVISAKLTLASTVGGGGACSYRVVRGPKIFNPGDDSLTIWQADSGKGQVPSDCRHLCLYRDCMVLAGPTNAPHLWFMSRSGDPDDWDYSADVNDALRAVSGQTEEAGLIAEPLTALAPFSDDYLLFCCENSLWILRGHPAYTGQIDNISRDCGVIDAQAWTWGPNGEFLFLSRNGLRVLQPGGSGFPEPLSQETLPGELLNINRDLHEVSLAYDRIARGVHIYVTPRDVG